SSDVCSCDLIPTGGRIAGSPNGWAFSANRLTPFTRRCQRSPACGAPISEGKCMQRTHAEIERLVAVALQQPGAVRRQHGIKFQCPACAAEGHDQHRDNACFFNNGNWGCAYTDDRGHWDAIGRTLGVLSDGSVPHATATAEAE